MTTISRHHDSRGFGLSDKVTSTVEQDFVQDIIAAGLLAESGVSGICHRSFEFEKIVRGIEACVSRAGGHEIRRQLFCSSVIDRSTLARCGFLTSFPDLVGALSSFAGSETDLATLRQRVESGGDWSDLLNATNLALCSAACQNVYPLLVDMPIPHQGLAYEVQAQCFRNEPSNDLARMMTFRQHEFVFIGTEHSVRAHAKRIQHRFCVLLDNLEISYEVVAANDPFFGRTGRLLAESQIQKSLKYEIVAPTTSLRPHAIGSLNFHEDHFGASFGLSMIDGATAHSSCVGFGLERVALAVLFRHGVHTAAWPAGIQQLLGLTPAKSSPESMELFSN